MLTGSATDKPYLSESDYDNLGIRQSIFPKQERPMVYQLFAKYLTWLQENDYYDSNISSYALLDKINPRYDYVVVDEAQDITNVQLSAILKSLNKQENFLLCGDSNQIVHPNFFSWSQVKTLFYRQDLTANIIRVLATNYRNTPEVTGIANRLLLIKNARFGSIDKESTYLVKANSANKGIVDFLPNSQKVNNDLNQKTRQSTKFAVLVIREEDKAEARKYFRTPLLFSIQEAKGLEYESITLFNMISSYDKTFREITDGVSEKDLNEESIHFSRAKDKSDRSLDEYKFYINALYVGMTRTINNLFLIEANSKHALLHLLGLLEVQQQTSLKNQQSSQEEWQEEARKLLLKRLFQPYIADNLKAAMPTFQRYGFDFCYEFNITPLMAAILFGSKNILAYLVKHQAKVTTVDNQGQNALQLALKTTEGQSIKSDILNAFYSYLKKAPLRVRIDKRLIKLESHQAEYLLINYMIANLRKKLIDGTSHSSWVYPQAKPAFQTRDFIDFYEGLGEQVIAEYCTKRPYISSILAKNEIYKGRQVQQEAFPSHTARAICATSRHGNPNG